MSLALSQQQDQLNHLLIIAKNAHESGLYSGIGGEQKIFMILMAAQELHISPMMALNGGLWNIQGKIEISARMINSMLRKAGIHITIKRSDSKGCVLEGRRPDTGDTCTVSFLEEDAARAGVLNRAPWKANPEDMYFARAISKLGRRLAPDILGTAYVEGEIRGEVFEERRTCQVDSQEPSKVIEMQIQPDMTPEEIDSYLTENWAGDEIKFKEFMEHMMKEKNWNYRKCVEICKNYLEHAKKNYMAWLSEKVGL